MASLTLRIPPSLGLPQNSTDPWSSDGIGVTGVPLFQWVIPILLPTGSVVSEVRARVKDNAIGPTTFALATFKMVDGAEDDTSGLGGVGTVSSGAGTWQTLVRPLDYTVAAGDNFGAFVFSIPTNAVAAVTKFAWIEVDYLPPQSD
jgi:hypothetical protein